MRIDFGGDFGTIVIVWINDFPGLGRYQGPPCAGFDAFWVVISKLIRLIGDVELICPILSMENWS